MTKTAQQEREGMPPKMQRFMKRHERKESKNRKRKARGMRSKISSKVGLALCEAQEWKCYFCGGKMRKQPHPKRKGMEATLDHLTPISRGGRNIKSNYAMVHGNCNSEKGSMTEQEYWVFLKSSKGQASCHRESNNE